MTAKTSEIKAEPKRWFRFYAESINDPKVQKLPPHLFKTWVNMLCLACSNGGKLPSVSDMAFQLRISDGDAQNQVDELIGLGLIDIIRADRAMEPHNWKARQYQSDTSKERTRKYRKSKAENACDVTVTAAVTPPDTDTDTEAETEQNTASQYRAAAPLPEVSDLKKLSDRLMDVASPCLASFAIAPGLYAMTVPQMWLDQGCDLERDVVPAIETIVRKGKRGVMAWDYFTKPIAEARAKRDAGMPAVNLSQPQRRGRLDMDRLAALVGPETCQ